jgi:gliding motility-associated-like protein
MNIMTKIIFITAMVILATNISFAQTEICNDGVDNDGDGLVDLNDSEDCFCDSIITNNIPSLIPNPSFEAFTCCPDDYSSLDCANTWMQASQATSDYFNTCGFTGIAPLPFPDGNAAAGVVCNDYYSEYFGACLNAVMQAGQQYNMQFDLAFEIMNEEGGHSASYPELLPPLEFTLYGTNICSDLPFTGTGCPLGQGNWQVLGTVTVDPNQIHGAWDDFFISFTPPINIRAIALGGPCSYPSGGEYAAGLSNPGGPLMPYFFVDNLRLNNASFWGIPITVEGEYCENDLVLSVDANAIQTVQWYLDGVAIDGEYFEELEISQNGLPPGNYTVVVSDVNNCATGYVTINAPIIDIYPIQNLSSCNEVYLPPIIGLNLTGNQNYYSQPNGQGYIVTSPVTEPMWVYAYDAIGNCNDQEPFFVNPFNSPNVHDIADQMVCDTFELPIITGTQLTGSQNYFYAPGGTGGIVTSPVTSTQTIYIYDGSSECADEESFTVTVYNTPEISEIPDLIGCTSVNLPSITGNFLTGNQNYYSMPNGQGSIVPDVLTYSQVIYAYDENIMCSDNFPINVTVYNDLPAYAGEDAFACGTSITLEATPSIPGSSGHWTGPGIIQNPNDTITLVTHQYGTYTYYWYESFDVCDGIDSVNISFIISPEPFISVQRDTVCTNSYNLSVSNVNYSGFWTAYNANDHSLITPAPLFIPSINSPNANAIVGNFDGANLDVEFVWTEQNQVLDNICSTTASTIIRFAKQPVASVGAIDEGESCGLLYSGLNADLTGCEWALHEWVSPELPCLFSDRTQPNSTVTLFNDGVFGDSAHIRIPLIWTVRNSGCSDMDTMWVTFYQKPDANAGINGSVCGFEYELEAYFDLTETINYTPSGIWSVCSGPTEETAVFYSATDTDPEVHVWETGLWQFMWRENNSLLTSCYDTDTVLIEFVEIPVNSAGSDQDICGTNTTLDATSGGNNGTWIHTPGATFQDFTNPQTEVNVSGPGEYYFAWLESNHAQTSTLSCSSIDSAKISFWPQPTANILTDEDDSTACGRTFLNLRAENPGSGIIGYWYDTWPATVYGNVNSISTWAQVYTYGCHDFYWIEQSGPANNPNFCVDTAGPLNICFIEVPVANAGADTIFCGLTGSLNAFPSVGTGVWSNPSQENITFNDENYALTELSSNIYNSDSENPQSFTLIWTEDNGFGCTDQDQVNVMFVEVPQSQITTIPPKCKGEQATISAVESNHPHYTWNYYSSSSITPQANEYGGAYLNLVSWNNTDTAHRISLIITNEWGCMSPICIDTVFEPSTPSYDFLIAADTCAIGKGALFIAPNDDISFFWLDENNGPAQGEPFDSAFNLAAGNYPVQISYLSTNLQHYAYYINTFGTANCFDTAIFEIPTIGLLEAQFNISTDVLIDELVAPNGNVTFINTSDYDDVRKRCEWHFDDGTTLKSCDEIIEHTYAEAGCYFPFLIIMNRELPECRDTARLEMCINVENPSLIEVPNIFSPNGDGINDYFQVKAQTLQSFNAQILNRWGNVIYTWTDWETYEAGWSGYTTDNSKASPGVYYYVIYAKGVDGFEYNLYGVFHLMREE